MKNKFTIIILLIVLVSGVLTAISFFSFDNKNVANQIDSIMEDPSGYENWLKNTRVVNSIELEDFTSVNLDDLNYFVSFKEGPEFKMEISSTQSKPKIYGVENIKVVGGVLNIPKLDLSDRTGISIYAKDLSVISVDAKDINGVMNIEGNLKNLKLNAINGVLNIEAMDTFDIKIGSMNGLLNMEFAEKNAIFNLQNLNSVANIFGKTMIDFEDDKNMEIIKGEGRDTITIENINGFANIN